MQPLRRKEGDTGAMFDEIEGIGHRRVWLCGGADVAGQALAVNRLSEVRVTIAPTVLGAGPALVEGKELPIRKFQLTDCRMNGSAVDLTWVRERD
jgi:riboflavin biosynthesis pyrimidine reductase